MFRAVVACTAVASVASFRVEVEVEDHKFNANTRWGASCEDLQALFHNRVDQMQSLMAANPDQSDFTAASQARFMMRSYGIIRTLRRARTCSWLVDGDSSEIEQVRGIVETLLAGNPCAEAARNELAAGRNAETAEIEMQAVTRAMSVLTSENCEVGDDATFTPVDDEEGLDACLEDDEDMAQQAVDDVMDAVETGETEGGAFVQTDSRFGFVAFIRFVGTLYFYIFLILACAFSVAAVGALIGFVLGFFTVLIVWMSGLIALGGAYAGFVGGGLLGVAGCGYELLLGSTNSSAPAALPWFGRGLLPAAQ